MRLCLSVAGGVAIPTGRYGSTDRVGAGGFLFLMVSPWSSLSVRTEGGLVRTSHKGSGSTQLTSFPFLSGSWYPNSWTASVRTYILAGIGGIGVDTDSLELHRFALGVGAGVSVRLRRSLRAFLEGRFMEVRAGGGTLDFVPVTLGLVGPITGN